MKTRQWLYPLLALLIGGAVVGLLMLNRSQPEKKSQEKPAPEVVVSAVALAPVQLQVTSQGLVESPYETQLVAQVSGEILTVAQSFVRGGLVKQGEQLAQIDPFNYQVKVQQAAASLASARASFILERAQGQVAEAEWAKITSAAPSELGLRKPQQEQALAAVKAAEANLNQAQKDLERTLIKAPYDAIVRARQISPGTYVNTGAVLGTLLDITHAEVRLPVNRDDLAFLQDGGLGAAVTLSTGPSGQPQHWSARILRNEGVVDEATRMVYLVAEVHDPYSRQTAGRTPLTFGTYVTAVIDGLQLPHAARVPRHLLRNGHLPLLDGETLKFAPVTVVRHEGKLSVIGAGLADGDRLITTALDHPVNGMKVSASAHSGPAISASSGGAPGSAL